MSNNIHSHLYLMLRYHFTYVGREPDMCEQTGRRISHCYRLCRPNVIANLMHIIPIDDLLKRRALAMAGYLLKKGKKGSS